MAAHLGYTVSELLARIDARELSEWIAYEKIAGPLGPARIDVAAAIVSATLVNVNRGKNKRAVSPDDFMPEWDQGRVQSDDEMWSAIRAAHNAMGGGKQEGGVAGGD